jgi:hypothetical protein
MSYYDSQFGLCLTITNKFCETNQTINPDTKTLWLDEDFNYSIDNLVLPSGLESIHFNFNFNQPIEQIMFPASVISLSFYGQFNQPVNKINIAQNLQILKLDSFAYNKPIDWGQFPNLLILSVGNDYIVKTLVFPKKLDYFMIGHLVSIPLEKIILPDTLKAIIYSDSSCSTIDLSSVNFPSELKILCLPSAKVSLVNADKGIVQDYGCYYFNCPDNLPESLQELKVPHIFKKPGSNLPSGLKKLTISDKYGYLQYFKIPFGCKVYNLSNLEIDNDIDVCAGKILNIEKN